MPHRSAAPHRNSGRLLDQHLRHPRTSLHQGGRSFRQGHPRPVLPPRVDRQYDSYFALFGEGTAANMTVRLMAQPSVRRILRLDLHFSDMVVLWASGETLSGCRTCPHPEVAAPGRGSRTVRTSLITSTRKG